MVLLATSHSSGGTSLLLPIILFGAVLYFFMIRPQRRRIRQQRALLARLEVGDQVRTVGGIFGVVIGLEPDSIVLGIEEGRVRVARSAIGTRIESESDDPAESSDGEG